MTKFFEERQGAAVLKHAILEQYLPLFVAKPGKFAPEHRVAYVDAYAGAGVYDSGEPGSPALAVATTERRNASAARLGHPAGQWPSLAYPTPIPWTRCPMARRVAEARAR